MTFGQTSIGRSLTRTRLLLKKQLWAWPIIAVVVLASLGYVVKTAIQNTMEDTLKSELLTLLTVERSMLEKWFKVQEANALTLANDPEIRQSIETLAATPTAEADGSESPLLTSKAQATLIKKIEAGMAAHDFAGYVVIDRKMRIIGALTRELIGQNVPQYDAALASALDGKTTVSAPFPSAVMLKDKSGKLRASTPTMFACVPVQDQNLQVIGVLAMRIRPEKEFTDILQLGRIGESGETYAVNQEGLLVSNSRFDEALILLGLIPDDDNAQSILNIQVRDPGGNLQDGYRPGVRRKELPLTHSAAAVTSGQDGVDMVGYRNYRGEPSVGAWTWLPDYKVGLITEIDVAEAYRPLTILKYSFFTLYGLLVLGAAAIFVFTIVVARLQREAQKAAVEARQLGQYRLEDKIGAGAMGVVYRGHHAMLRRPTAIKMLDVDRINEASIQRFEREVQITCNLNNSHTVAIYDYGRTPEGVFYYAMEYLDGIDLQRLVDQYGPQPEGRVVNILRQICASLYEAHSMGLVHRDIKPANVMLNRRGAEPDVVKVLDFGLVKALDAGREESQDDLSGTPLYMPPEAIQTPELVDARSDLYAVGAVGYYLLTGQTVFFARTLGELCQQHISAIPDAPSHRLGRPVSQELEHAILACMEKNRSKRPQTARDLAAMLDRVVTRWTLDDAEEWWSRHERQVQSPPAGGGTETGSVARSQNQNEGTEVRSPAPEDMPTGFDRTTLFESEDHD